MEHYRSTLGTAAVAVSGLVLAAHVLHPGNFEDRSRPARPVVALAAASVAPTVARFEPPFDAYLRPGSSDFEMTVLAPRLTAPLATGMTMASILPAGVTAAVDRPTEAHAPGRREASPEVARAGQIVSRPARTARAVPPAVRSRRIGPLDVTSRNPVPARGGEG